MVKHQHDEHEVTMKETLNRLDGKLDDLDGKLNKVVSEQVRTTTRLDSLEHTLLGNGKEGRIDNHSKRLRRLEWFVAAGYGAGLTLIGILSLLQWASNHIVHIQWKP